MLYACFMHISRMECVCFMHETWNSQSLQSSLTENSCPDSIINLASWGRYQIPMYVMTLSILTPSPASNADCSKAKSAELAVETSTICWHCFGHNR